MNTVTLNNGVKMPQLGFGVYQIPKENTTQAVYDAIKIGYRLIDTATAYQNEKETGLGIKKAILDGLVKREELFITSKLFILETPEEKAWQTIQNSLKIMDLDYLDLYLIHQPYGDIYGAWRALVKARKNGLVRCIGVSNFKVGKMVEFSWLNEVKPQINQIEVNPWYQRITDQVWHEKYGVQIQCWAPFAEGKNNLFNNPILNEIGQKYHKTAAQVVLRWLIQRNMVVLAKSIHKKRMSENIDVFDFELSKKDLAQIETLDQNQSAFFDHDDPVRIEGLKKFLTGE